MKKYLGLGVLLAILALTQAACGDADSTGVVENTNATNDSVTEAVTEDPALRDNLPETDLGGYNFRMLLLGTEAQQMMTYIDKQDGNIVNDAVYEKIKSVEERFNVDITQVEVTLDNTDDVSIIRQSVMAGDDMFEMAQGHDVSMANLSLEGMFMNVYDIPYLDTTRLWWPQDTVESMTVADQMYLMINNISYLNLASTMVMYFNKDLFDTLKIEYPYETVKDGVWTMDKMLEISAQGYHDLNGNGARDEYDRYGFAHQTTYYCWLEPFKVEPYKKNKDGVLYYEVDLERLTTVTEKFYDLLFGPGGYQVSGTDRNSEIALEIFTSGRSLFRFSSLNNAATALSKSNVVYGVVPIPKLDETQDGYYSGANDRPIGVPITLSNLEAAGIVIEALNDEGYKRVYPAFYEIAMKNRYADQTEDAQMMDLVRDTTITSFTYLFGDYSSVYNIMLEKLFNKSPSTDVASWCAKNEKKQVKHVQKLMEFYEENMES